MFTKLVAATLVAVGLAALPASAVAGPRSIDRRQADQRTRIAAGVRTGALTPREASRLVAQQRAIAREERVYRRNGLQPWERADLHRDLNRASRAIAWEKRDWQRW